MSEAIFKTSEVQCYQCGKAIVKEEDITMKNVSLGWFNEERKPFHKECWRKYHGREMKKSVISYGGLLVFFFGAIFVAYLAFNFGAVFYGILPLIALGSLIALLIYLGIVYYRIEK